MWGDVLRPERETESARAIRTRPARTGLQRGRSRSACPGEPREIERLEAAGEGDGGAAGRVEGDGGGADIRGYVGDPVGRPGGAVRRVEGHELPVGAEEIQARALDGGDVDSVGVVDREGVRVGAGVDPQDRAVALRGTAVVTELSLVGGIDDVDLPLRSLAEDQVRGAVAEDRAVGGEVDGVVEAKLATPHVGDEVRRIGGPPVRVEAGVAPAEPGRKAA